MQLGERWRCDVSSYGWSVHSDVTLTSPDDVKSHAGDSDLTQLPGWPL